MDNDWCSILQAISSSDVVEGRIELLYELSASYIPEKCDLTSVAEFLTSIWEDFTCLDISQCMLNKAILHVAEKCIQCCSSEELVHFLGIGTKGSLWCEKHLTMTLMSSSDSEGEEEHSNLFFQLIRDLLSFVASFLSFLGKEPLCSEVVLLGPLQKFVSAQLNFIMLSVSETKRINSLGSDLLNMVQPVIDAVVELCKVHSQIVNWKLHSTDISEDDTGKSEPIEVSDLIIDIIKCVIEKVSQIGTLAANNGGTSVTILNISWKGVVNLLHLGKGALSTKVNIPNIISNLVSLATESLRSAAEAWSSSLKEHISSAEAKRKFVPAKFYLINAVRISSLYPRETCSLYQEIALCAIMVSTFAIFLAKEVLLRNVSEASAEFLEPTTFRLLKSLLNSQHINEKLKFQMLDFLFASEGNSISSSGEEPRFEDQLLTLDRIFSIRCDMLHEQTLLLPGRVSLYAYFLTCSFELEDSVCLGISKKLDWFLSAVTNEAVYSLMLVLEIPLFDDLKTHNMVWHPMLAYVLRALKSFMVAVASSVIWGQVLSFLIRNSVHPHFLCREMIMELWCFFAGHAEAGIVSDIIDKLVLLFNSIASPTSIFIPGSSVRSLARTICLLCVYCGKPTVDRVYTTVSAGEKSRYSSLLYIALLLEEFPLNMLTDEIKARSMKRIIMDYASFVGSFCDKLHSQALTSSSFGMPVFVLSATLNSIQVYLSNIDANTLKLLVSCACIYVDSSDNEVKDQSRKLLSEVLGLVSSIKQLYSLEEIEEVISVLQKLFISQGRSDFRLDHCKPKLANFLAGLVHLEMEETEASSKSCAVWDLYHMLLKERHWAFIHLALSAFGYFAARTSCNQLWRFVPQDAALSFDLETGEMANEERFMGEFKAFLDKEKAVVAITPSTEELILLKSEGLLIKVLLERETLFIKEIVEKMLGNSLDVIRSETLVNKRRRLPDGMCKGMELLENGLRAFKEGLLEWQQHQPPEIHESFLTQISCLEQVIGNLTGLAG